VALEGEESGAGLGVPQLRRAVRARGDDPRPVGTPSGRKDEVCVSLEGDEVRVAEAMDVVPLPPAQVGRRAFEQGHGRGNVVLVPVLVGHLHRQAVLEYGELLARPHFTVTGRLGLAPRLLRLAPGGLLAVAGRLGRGL